MQATRNIIWIMCDQLRRDYLSCYGHSALITPNIDRLADRGVRFDNAYVQSTICGPSRMSAYTGRYVRTHGSTTNGVPLKVGEPTLGDHLNQIGVRNVLVGKTHMAADSEGMARLGIEPDSIIGVHVAQCGFEPYERDDGLHPDGSYDPDPEYDRYLRDHGFDSDNPWEHWANSADGDDGTLLNGWLLSHADKPARIPDEHSETPYMTNRAMEFIREVRDSEQPWLLHLSYIKPHWPYIVPAPYHAMYGEDDLLPVIRSDNERANPHPIYRAFMEERYSVNFSRDEIRRRVLPAYMGLIKQVDDQVGRLMEFLDAQGMTNSTMIVFSSDHGDYLGDHWLGEKYLFHEQSVNVPLIVVDPDERADATRGSTSKALVEMIDLAPTFLESFGGAAKPHVLEGRALQPLLHDNAAVFQRKAVISEYDYAVDLARLKLSSPTSDSRMTMVFDGRWKFIHVPGQRPMLFDLSGDPQEFDDLGGNPAYRDEITRLQALMFNWARRPATRTTVSDAQLESGDHLAEQFDLTAAAGVIIGYWDEMELEADTRRRAAVLRSVDTI